MKLIVDSGSTKTDWCFASSKDTCVQVATDGINPVVQSADEIRAVVHGQLVAKAEAACVDLRDVDGVYFYGAGCTPECSHVVSDILRGCLAECVEMRVDSDLLAAAHALCGHDEGVACILGTGSNSCYYDGEKIVMNTPALGYVLGDEGSGSVLGRRFLNGVLKGWLPQGLREDFFLATGMDKGDIIYKVYHEKMPNRFLASLSKYIHAHLDVPELEDMVVRNFEEFIAVNLRPYGSAPRIVNAVGSVAFHYESQLRKAALRQGYDVGKVMKSPLVGLLDYHFGKA